MVSTAFRHHAAIATALMQRGWCVTADFLPGTETRSLLSQAQALHEAGTFRAAAMGHGAGRTADATLRGDEILWLESAQASGAVGALFNRFEALRLGLNEQCLLGLFDVELHFARYAPGSRYTRHLDRFRDDSARVVSCVLYLNEDWNAEDGGQLRLYASDDAPATVDVMPRAGTLVTFLSERFPHEVLPARRERWSVTGWFRTRGVS